MLYFVSKEIASGVAVHIALMIICICLSASCPEVIGFPSVPLPYTDVSTVHLLPQIRFPCNGLLMKVHLYAMAVGDITFGIGRWKELLQTAEVVETFTVRVTQTRRQLISVDQNDIQVSAGDFVILFADPVPLPLGYITDTDIGAIKGDIQMVIKAERFVNVSKVGDLIDVTSTAWSYKKMTFSLSFEVDSQQLTVPNGKSS